MFEDSLFSSRSQGVTVRSRWTAVVSISVQVLLVGLVLAVPLLRPEVLPVLSLSPAVILAPRPVPPPVAKPQVVRPTSANALGPGVPNAIRVETLRGILPAMGRSLSTANEADGVSLVSFGLGMSSGQPGGLGTSGSADSSGSRVVVSAAKPAAKQRISAGVSAGMLLQPMHPVYPAIAKAAHVEGTVVVTATIDKGGQIVGLQVVSGPAMLRSAAVDAVRAARYRPFLLNGEPAEVETTVSVNFRMSGG